MAIPKEREQRYGGRWVRHICSEVPIRHEGQVVFPDHSGHNTHPGRHESLGNRCAKQCDEPGRIYRPLGAISLDPKLLKKHRDFLPQSLLKPSTMRESNPYTGPTCRALSVPGRSTNVTLPSTQQLSPGASWVWSTCQTFHRRGIIPVSDCPSQGRPAMQGHPLVRALIRHT